MLAVHPEPCDGRVFLVHPLYSLILYWYSVVCLPCHRKLPTNKMMGVDSQNELVMRVQPDEVSE